MTPQIVLRDEDLGRLHLGDQFLVRAYPRLHMALIDCGDATARLYGGVGVALDAPITEVHARASDRFELVEPANGDPARSADLRAMMQRFERSGGLPPVRVEVRQTPEAHIGLGTKTSLLLAVAVSLSVAAGRPLEPELLCALTKRGGTSGIGVNAFFRGGWVVDAGQPRSDAASFAPSSAGTPSSRPPVSVHRSVHPDWVFHLILPPGTRLAGEAERRVFDENCPLPESEVLRVLAAVYHGLVPAILTSDLVATAEALNQLTATGFKRREIEAQGPSVELIMNEMRALDRPVGMSSMGPLLFLIDDSRDLESRLVELAASHGATYLGAPAGVNHGATIE